MAMAAWENEQTPYPMDISAQLKTVWDSLQKSKESWKCQQRLALFDSCEMDDSDRRTAESKQTTSFRQLQALYEKAETNVVKWRQMAAMNNDASVNGKCQEFLQMLIQNSCICVRQPPPIIDGDAKRSRPQVELRVLTGKISNSLQDGQAEIALALLTEEQARTAVEGRGLPSSSDYKVEWHGKCESVPLTWDSAIRCFRARFTDVVLKKPNGQKWLDGYHIYFFTRDNAKKGVKSPVPLSCLTTPFEIVSNRTGQKPHKMRNEFWRLAFGINDSNSSTVGLKSTVPSESFLDIFDRWFRGLTGVKNGLNEEHKRSIGQLLKIRESTITWERFKKNWSFLYHAAEYVKENTFLWNTGILNYCFATREEAEKILSQYQESTMMIRFQNSAPGYLSISFIMPAETVIDGRYFAHCPLESYFKRNYTLVQCIEFADLLTPTGKRIKSKLRDFKILGVGEKFDYREILDEDERTRERVYAFIQNRQTTSDSGEGAGNERGPLMEYSTVKERFKIKTTKFPEAEFTNAMNSFARFSVSPSIDSPLTVVSSAGHSPPSSTTSVPSVEQKRSNSFDTTGMQWLSPSMTPNGMSGQHTPSFLNNTSTPDNFAVPRYSPGVQQLQPQEFSQMPPNPNLWQVPVVPQQTPTPLENSTDCTVVFDYRLQNQNPQFQSPQFNQVYPQQQTPHFYQQQAESNVIQSNQPQTSYHQASYQPTNDQTVTDDDLATILAAFNNFNDQAAPPEQRFDYYSKAHGANTGYLRNGVDDSNVMDFEMTPDYLVPNQ